MRLQCCLGAVLLASACGPAPADEPAAANAAVNSSGKQPVALGQLPPEVSAAALERMPDMTITAAQSETRDGRRYFDVEGSLADGSEIELDMMEQDGRWRVVETQRDIALGQVPEAVRAALRGHDSGFVPNRIIESRQEDELVIYELFGPAGSDPAGRKVEIKWDGREASVLAREWAH